MAFWSTAFYLVGALVGLFNRLYNEFMRLAQTQRECGARSTTYKAEALGPG
jgi:hypothetical protein